jgi:hypothetical protein
VAPDLFGLALGAELTTQFDGGQPLAQRVEFPGGLLGIASLDQSGCGEPGYLVAQPAAGRMARALKPGGWLLLAHGRLPVTPSKTP